MKHKSANYVCAISLGYFAYRAWAYLDAKVIKQGNQVVREYLAICCYPLTNFSSATILLCVTLIRDGPSIFQFILSLYDESLGM